MEINMRHGGPYDRGGADSYYGRKFEPHYYKGDIYVSERVTEKCMTTNEIAEYTAGYKDNDDFKDWGYDED